MAASSSWDRGRRSCPSGPRRPSGPGRAGPGRAAPGRARLPHHMGLLDYYRQFEAIGEEEINRELRERRRREHAVAIEWVPGARPRRYRVARPSERGGRERLDLRGPRAGQRLPRPPCHPAAAQTGRPPRCRARADRGRQRRRRAAPDGGARVARAQRRARHAMALLSALSAHGPACGRPAGGRRAVDRRRRPRGGPRRNDRPYPRGDDLQPQRPDRHVPRGEPPGRAARGPAGARACPARRGLAQFQDVEDRDAGLALVEAFPRLLVLRTFSKVYGLSGLRAGYVVGSPQAGGLLDALAPALGVNALSQAAAEQALKIGDGEVDGRSCSTDARACSTRWPPCRSMPRRARPTSSGCARRG